MRQSNAGVRIVLVLACGCQQTPSEGAPSLPEVRRGPRGDATGRPAAVEPAPSSPPLAPTSEPTAIASSEPPAAHLEGCAHGFEPRTEPRIDVRRLGMTCGPSNGLVRWLRPMRGHIGEDGTEGHHRLKLEAGACIRLAIVAERGIGDLELEVMRQGESWSRATVETRWALLPPDRLLCPDGGDTDVDVVVRTHSGSGTYVIDGWRTR